MRIYKEGEKVSFKDVSWHDKIPYKINGVIIGKRELIKAEGHENKKKVYYHIKPTLESVKALWDIDMEELAKIRKNPKLTYIPISSIKKGWVNEIGYGRVEA